LSNLDRYKTDLGRLKKLSDEMYNDLVGVASKKKTSGAKIEPGMLFFSLYQQWYTEAHEVIRQIIPSRLSEFENLYSGDKKRKNFDSSTYTINDWLLGIRAKESAFGEKAFNDVNAVFMRFQMQKEILESAKIRFESSLMDIRQILQAELFDSELEAARALLKNGFSRASGAVAGVVAEKHLMQICQNHHVVITKKDPTITTYNDALKKKDVIEVQQWRFIQRLGDLRNLCDHNKDREPTREDVDELIAGVDKLQKTIF